jgi:hypothetical protein
MADISSDRSFVVSSPNNHRKASLASLSAPGGIFSVTITTLGYVLFGRADEWPFSNHVAMWRAICLKEPRSAQKKQKTSAKGKSRRV